MHGLAVAAFPIRSALMILVKVSIDIILAPDSVLRLSIPFSEEYPLSSPLPSLASPPTHFLPVHTVFRQLAIRISFSPRLQALLFAAGTVDSPLVLFPLDLAACSCGVDSRCALQIQSL